MNLKKATTDELAMELARRGEFILILPGGKRGPEVDIHMKQPKKAVNILAGAAKMLEGVVKSDGKLPENVKLIKKSRGVDGTVQEVEVDDAKDILDPWEPNKIGDYNPWQEGQKSDQKPEETTEEPPDFKIDHEMPKDAVEVEEPSKEAYDPWNA